MNYVVAKGFARMKGLLGKRRLPRGVGLLIPRCNAVHTIGMRYTLDLYFIDAQGSTVRIIRSVPPGKFFVWGGRKAKSVIEYYEGEGCL